MGWIVRSGAGVVLAVAFAAGGGGCVYPYWRQAGPFVYPVAPPAQASGSTAQLPPVTVQPPPVKSQPTTSDNRGTAPANPPPPPTGEVTVDHKQPAPPSVMPPTGQGGAAPPAAGANPLPLPSLPQPPANNPHVRDSATARGGRLDLGPNDYPIDRVLEITRRLEECAAVNQMLMSRLTSVEKEGKERESAMNEVLRDMETAAAEVVRARADLTAVKRELDALKERLKRVEREEVETLKTVIAAVEKLVRQQEEQ
jgi:hypothetical protein